MDGENLSKNGFKVLPPRISKTSFFPAGKTSDACSANNLRLKAILCFLWKIFQIMFLLLDKSVSLQYKYVHTVALPLQIINDDSIIIIVIINNKK